MSEAELAARIGAAILDALRLAARDAAPASAAPAPEASRWMTPPAAARETGVPVKTIRALVKSGELTPRLRNQGANPKAPKYLVNVDDVAAAAERHARAAVGAPAPALADAPAPELLARVARIRAGGRR